jgi:hypothetical protein
MKNENETECVICYRELNMNASSFSCSHNVLCADCNKRWTKSCPLCRSERTRIQQTWSTQYHELNLEDNSHHRTLSERTHALITSSYDVEIRSVWYGKHNNPYFEQRYILKYYVDRTNHLKNVHRTLCSIYSSENHGFSVTTTHTNNCIHIYF